MKKNRLLVLKPSIKINRFQVKKCPSYYFGEDEGSWWASWKRGYSFGFEEIINNDGFMPEEFRNREFEFSCNGEYYKGKLCSRIRVNFIEE